VIGVKIACRRGGHDPHDVVRAAAHRRRRRVWTCAGADRDPATTRLRGFAALDATRPTAVNLRWALDRARDAVLPLDIAARADAAWREADAIAVEDEAMNQRSASSAALLREVASRRLDPCA
jgi:methylthioribose-1-phosphate isomerase